MDPSLAKGVKNQLFRDIYSKVSTTTDDLVKYSSKSNLKNSNRNEWIEHVKNINKIVGRFSLATSSIGSKRKPTLLLYVFEDKDRSFNTWEEKCVSSELLQISINPFFSKVTRAGFNISEHAIQRIFERAVPHNNPIIKDEIIHVFLNELRFAPVISAYWHLLIIQEIINARSRILDIIIPSINGLFLGQISVDNCNRCEIRTFVPLESLSLAQRQSRDLFLKFAETYENTEIAFLIMSTINQVQIKSELINNFMRSSELLRDRFTFD